MGLSCASKISGFRSLVLGWTLLGLSIGSWAPVAFAQSSDEAAHAPTAAGATSSDAPNDQAAADSDSAASSDATTETELPAPGKISFQPNVQRIFNEHCLECHGPKQSKADLRVDQRDALLSYIAPGDLESSSLWSDYLTTTDPEMRMPPIKHGNPLNELELAAIRVWIEDGADWPENLAPVAENNAAGAESAAALTTSGAPAATAEASRGTMQKMWTFVGFFHPAVVHFPIGLLLVSTLFIALAFVKREAFEPAAFHCLWIGTAGAVAASVAGWAFAEIRGYGDFWHTHWNTDLIARHRISGVAVTSFAIGLSLLAFFARKRTGSGLRILWLMGAVALAGLVSLVGHQGGELTYGEELFARAYERAFGPSESTETIAPTEPNAAVTKP